jgi:exopolysaccharide biosynthesis polyprenyl glycosylphosphotransferase
MHQLVDAGVFALGFWIACQVRTDPELTRWLGLTEIQTFRPFLWLYLVLMPAAPMILEAQGFYSRPPFCSRWTTMWLLFKGCALTCLTLILALYSFQLLIGRGVVIWFGFFSFVLVFAKEEIVRQIRECQVVRPQNRRRFLLLGSADETARIQAELKTHGETGVDVVAQLDLNRTTLAQLLQSLHENSINGVIVSAKNSYFDQVEAVIQACEVEGVEAWLFAEFFKTQISRTSFDDFYGRPLLVFRSTPEASWQSYLKLAIDFCGALAGLLITAPLLGLIALLIRLTSPGPVLFRQQRSGLNGRPFTIYKFRTMVTDAEQRKHELEAMNEMSGPVFKMANDPRITRLGRLLRRFSLDEFPQLINVLRGDMSLVGPRPLPVDEVKRFNDLAHRRRLSVKPGLTCLWQISGRNDVRDFKDWVRLDLEYIDNWSLWLDLKILWRTVPAVLTGTGAK